MAVLFPLTTNDTRQRLCQVSHCATSTKMADFPYNDCHHTGVVLGKTLAAVEMGGEARRESDGLTGMQSSRASASVQSFGDGAGNLAWTDKGKG